jgi:hypothetical protein
MSGYIKLIENLFDHYEKSGLTEEDIFDKCVNLIRSHKNDPEYTWTLNDTLYNRGYSFQFVVHDPRKKFDGKSYGDLTSQVTKSKAKTQALWEYLFATKDHRLILASLHMLKVQFLVDLGYMQDSPVLDNKKSFTMRELLYGNYDNEQIKKIVKSTLDSMGMVDALTKVGDFWLDMEYLLWTIERDDPKYGHLKINTIKVATAIAPKSYFERDDKIYYSVHTSKDFKKYIKLIDKTAASKMKDKWGEMGYETLQDGYRLLHQYL